MISGIAIENFKGIREPVKTELRSITLLFGGKSAGKSSILHTPRRWEATSCRSERKFYAKRASFEVENAAWIDIAQSFGLKVNGLRFQNLIYVKYWRTIWRHVTVALRLGGRRGSP